MKLDPQKPPPWKNPGFLPMVLVMMVASGLIIARGSGGRDVLFGERTERRGLGDVPFRPRLTPSASASASTSAAPAVPPAASSSAGD